MQWRPSHDAAELPPSLQHTLMDTEVSAAAASSPCMCEEGCHPSSGEPPGSKENQQRGRDVGRGAERQT